MLFAISGTQGCGKSTTITDLTTQYKNKIERIPSQASRTSLAQMGYTLMEIYVDPTLTMEFQELVLQNKLNDELSIKQQKDKVYVIERSYIDLAAYTILNLGKLNHFNEQVNQYVKKCLQYQQLYNGTVFIIGNKFSIEDDNVRPVNPAYADAIELMQQKLLTGFDNTLTVTVSDRKQRTELIANYMIGQS